MEELEQRFWERVEKTGDCWVWKGAISHGYGKLRNFVLPTWVAHRLSYLINRGPIPAGLLVCHRCDNPPCVKPDHLFLGTYGDNNRDSHAKGRHPMEGEHGPNAKLTDAKVREIRDLLANGARVYLVARRFGVDPMTIAHIRDRKTWVHIA